MKDQCQPLARLDCEQAELLPARQALGGLTINNIVGVNVAIAVSAGGWASHATAIAEQWLSAG